MTTYKRGGEEVIEESQNNSENSKVTEEMLLTNILRMVTVDYLQGDHLLLQPR